MDDLARLSRKQLIAELRRRDPNQLEEKARIQMVEAQNLLQESWDRYSELYELAPFGHATLDCFGIVREINLAATTLFGTQRGRILGAPLLGWVAPAKKGVFIHHLRELREAEGIVTCELDLMVDGGKRLPAQLVSRRRTPDPSSSTLTAIIDLSKRRDIEQALQITNDALERRTRESEARAHRLKGLTAALAAAERRERTRIAHVVHEDLQQLLAASKLQLDLANGETNMHIEAAKDLVARAIKVSRTLAAELGEIPLSVGLGPALMWLGELMQTRYGLTVTVEISRAAEEILEAADDEATTRLVFDAVRELLFNVVKHAGIARAEVDVARSGPDDLVVIIHDRGKGYRLSSDKKPSFGLAAIRERMEWVGGSLLVESTPGWGTRATLRVPNPSTPRSDRKANGVAKRESRRP